MDIKNLKIGFVGQGFVGKNYADDFESRGYKVIRYSQELDHIDNKDLIKECDVVFIAVPTPTTSEGFDDSILASTLNLIGKCKIAVIKSTIVPGTTKILQTSFPEIVVMHSPEFLSEKTAAFEAANPTRNIVGIVEKNEKNENAAKLVLSILPKSPFEIICSAEEAEVIKYAHNCFGFFTIIFGNLLYDLAKSYGANWENIKSAIDADTEKSSTYFNPVHKTGRGAGGRCFIKDFAAFRQSYEDSMSHDKLGISVLTALEQKNIDLLKSTNKSIDIIKQIYG
jgi:nucleotide sugar dehydrogenase